MNKQKIVRDVIIIVLIVIVGFLVFKNKGTGPAEAGGGTPAMGGAGGHGGGSEQMTGHPQKKFEMSDGQAVITLGGLTVGDQWLGEMLEVTKLEYINTQQMDEVAATELARNDVLLSSLQTLVRLSAIEEFGIEADQSDIDKSEEQFNSQFEDEADKQALFDGTGWTMDDMRRMWSKQSIESSFFRKIAELKDVDPENKIALDSAYAEWMQEMIETSDWVFGDEALQAMYDSGLNYDPPDMGGGGMMMPPADGAHGGGGDPHGASDSDPHAGM